MEQIMNIIFLAALPFIGTSAGAGSVFFLNKISDKTEKFLYGFAAGVMMAASVWSLLLPASDMSGSWVAPFWGFICGAVFLIALEYLVSILESKGEDGTKSEDKIRGECIWKNLIKNKNQIKSEGGKKRENKSANKSKNKSSMLAFAVTLHNLPEGMAVGVVLAGLISGMDGVTFSDAFALTLGIAIQNFPEGAIISLPKRNIGKTKAFMSGFLSGVVEPIGVIITILLVSQVTACLPFLLSFAAGAMIYVVAEELIPESHHKAGVGAIGASAGFALMMLLDMALG